MPPKKTNAGLSKPLLPTDKMPLPMFLKHLNDAGMSMPNAMSVAAKIYKVHNTPEKLGSLDAASLAKFGIDSKEMRTQILLAFSKFKSSSTPVVAKIQNAEASSSSIPTGRVLGGEEDVFGFQINDIVDDTEQRDRERREVEQKRQAKAEDLDQKRRNALETFQEKLQKKKGGSPKKRKRDDGSDDIYYRATEPPPSDPLAVGIASFDFHEVLDEEELQSKVIKINRAPVMMAWSCIVAEKLGFAREEALSIASAYTEMNATTRGVNLGIYEKGKEMGMEPGSNTAQPHVELMGRRIPLFQTENGQWRALMKGDPVSPAKAYSYITRSLAQMSPYLLGALQVLASSYDDPQLLNNKGYSLYSDFRPENSGWGLKGEIKLESILRNKQKKDAPSKGVEKVTKLSSPKISTTEGETFEEFEALEGEGDFTLWDLYEGQE